ncbi:hypothetical protein RFI_28794, partial [Reticulomyxa filosa]
MNKKHPSQYVLNDAQVAQKGIDFWENHNKHSSVNEEWWKMQLAERQKLKKKQKHISQQSLYISGDHNKMDTIAALSGTTAIQIDQIDDSHYDDIEPSVIIHGVAHTPSTTNIRHNYVFDSEEPTLENKKINDKDKDKDNTTTFLGYAPTGFQLEYQKLLEDYREANDLLLQSEQDKEIRLKELKEKQEKLRELENKIDKIEKELIITKQESEERLNTLNKSISQNETIKQQLENELTKTLREVITKEISNDLLKQQQISNDLIQSQWNQQLQNLEKQWNLAKQTDLQIQSQLLTNQFQSQIDQFRIQDKEKDD